MRPILAVVIALLLAPTMRAQCGTRVQGTAVGTWTTAGSPYCVTGHLLVSRDVGPGSLTVESGVRVVVSPGAEIRVTGALLVRGTAAAPVVFTAADPARPWAGVFFDRAGPGSSLDHARIELSDQGGLRVVDSPLTLQGCELRRNTTRSGGGGLDASLATGDLVLRDCRIEDNTAELDGGGLLVRLGEGRLLLERCSVRRNAANPNDATRESDGGGLHATGGRSIVLTDCEIGDNSCKSYRDTGPVPGVFARGGGIYAAGTGEVAITDCLVVDNESRCHSDSCYDSSYARGGGICIENAPALVTRCILRGNRCIAFEGVGGYGGCQREQAVAEGGGLYWEGRGTLLARNCVFSGNHLDTRANWVDGLGAGIAAGSYWSFALAGTLLMTNCTVARNHHRADGPVQLAISVPGVSVTSGFSASIANSIVYQNSSNSFLFRQIAGAAEVDYSNVEGGWPGVGNLSVDPRFAAPGSTACGAVEITQGSPCVDAGNPSRAFDDTSFPPSLGGPRNDMGANGGPLAGAWANWARPAITLSIDPPRRSCTGTDPRFVTAGGAMTRPVAVFLEAISGVPVGPFGLPGPGRFCAAGRWELGLAFPPVVCSVGSLTFRSYALDAGGRLVSSNAVVW